MIMIIERVENIVTLYDGGDLHKLDVRVIELQQAFEANLFMKTVICSVV